MVLGCSTSAQLNLRALRITNPQKLVFLTKFWLRPSGRAKFFVMNTFASMDPGAPRLIGDLAGDSVSGAERLLQIGSELVCQQTFLSSDVSTQLLLKT